MQRPTDGPVLISWRTLAASGPKRYLYASRNGSPTRSRHASTARVSDGVGVTGFSQSTALPASRAAIASSAWVVCTVPTYTASTSSRCRISV